MLPAAITRTVPGGSGATETAPLSPIGIGLVKAAVPDASRPQMTATYTAASQPRHGKAIQLAGSGAPAKTGSYPCSASARTKPF